MQLKNTHTHMRVISIRRFYYLSTGVCQSFQRDKKIKGTRACQVTMQKKEKVTSLNTTR